MRSAVRVRSSALHSFLRFAGKNLDKAIILVLPQNRFTATRLTITRSRIPGQFSCCPLTIHRGFIGVSYSALWVGKRVYQENGAPMRKGGQECTTCSRKWPRCRGLGRAGCVAAAHGEGKVSDRGRATARCERPGDRFDSRSAPTLLAGADRRGPDHRLRCACHGGERGVSDQLVIPPDRHPARCCLSGCRPVCDPSPVVGSQTKMK